MNSRILIIGNINRDIAIAALRVSGKAEKSTGEEIKEGPLMKYPGCSSLAGHTVGELKMVGCIGEEVFEMSLIENFEENRENAKKIIYVPDISTGIVYSILNNGNHFTVVRPEIKRIVKADIIDSLEEVLKCSDIAAVQGGISFEAIEIVAELCKSHNVKLLFVPAANTVKFPNSFYKKIDIFAATESEAEKSTGIPIHNLDDVKKAVKLLMGKGVKQTVIISGTKGVIYNDGINVIHKAVYGTQSINADASGDLFIGALAVYMSMRKNINEAVEYDGIVSSAAAFKKDKQTQKHPDNP